MITLVWPDYDQHPRQRGHRPAKYLKAVEEGQSYKERTTPALQRMADATAERPERWASQPERTMMGSPLVKRAYLPLPMSLLFAFWVATAASCGQSGEQKREGLSATSTEPDLASSICFIGNLSSLDGPQNRYRAKPFPRRQLRPPFDHDLPTCSIEGGLASRARSMVLRRYPTRSRVRDWCLTEFRIIGMIHR